MISRICLLALVCLLWVGGARATTLDAGTLSRQDLAGHVGLLEDPGAALDIDGARAADGFHAAEGGSTSLGFSHSAWWARVTLANPGPQPLEVVLRQDYPLIDELDVWTVRDGAVQTHVATGDQRRFDTRPIAHRDFLFPITLPAGSETEVYVRLKTQGAVNIGLSVYRPDRLMAQLSLEQLAFGLYFGGFIVLIFYNLFIFLAVRDRAFLYYLLYVASYGLYFGIHDGLSFQFLWPDSPRWANTSLLVMLSLTLVFGLQFTRTFLDMRRLSPRLDRVALAGQALSVAGLLLSLVVTYNSAVVYLAWLTVAVTALILAMGVVGLLRRQVSARYFMIAWAVLLSGVMVYMAKTFGWLPHNAFTQNGFQIGALLEMVLLSLALAHRVRELSHLSRTDALTQLVNRRVFDETLALEFARCRRRGQPLSLLVLDIDHFKAVNDTQGHAHGDRMLKRLAALLLERVGNADHVSRYGGEEFTVILPGTDVAGAAELAESICQAVRASLGGGPSITISIGVAASSDPALANPDALFRAADEALYRAKAAGRDRVASHPA